MPKFKAPSISISGMPFPRTTAGRAALFGSAGLAVAITLAFAVIGPKKGNGAVEAVAQPTAPVVATPAPAVAPTPVVEASAPAPALVAAPAPQPAPVAVAPAPAPVVQPAPVAVTPAPAPVATAPVPVATPAPAPAQAVTKAPRPAPRAAEQEQLSDADRAQLRALRDELRKMKESQ